MEVFSDSCLGGKRQQRVEPATPASSLLRLEMETPTSSSWRCHFPLGNSFHEPGIQTQNLVSAAVLTIGTQDNGDSPEMWARRRLVWLQQPCRPEKSPGPAALSSSLALRFPDLRGCTPFHRGRRFSLVPQVFLTAVNLQGAHGHATGLPAIPECCELCVWRLSVPHFSVPELPKQSKHKNKKKTPRTSKTPFIHSSYENLLSTCYVAGSGATSVKKSVSSPGRAHLRDHHQHTLSVKAQGVNAVASCAAQARPRLLCRHSTKAATGPVARGGWFWGVPGNCVHNHKCGARLASPAVVC